jgi:hypothetical protein
LWVELERRGRTDARVFAELGVELPARAAAKVRGRPLCQPGGSTTDSLRVRSISPVHVIELQGLRSPAGTVVGRHSRSAVRSARLSLLARYGLRNEGGSGTTQRQPELRVREEVPSRLAEALLGDDFLRRGQRAVASVTLTDRQQRETHAEIELREEGEREAVAPPWIRNELHPLNRERAFEDLEIDVPRWLAANEEDSE